MACIDVRSLPHLPVSHHPPLPHLQPIPVSSIKISSSSPLPPSPLDRDKCYKSMAALVMKTRPKRLKHLPANTNMDPPLQYPDYAITTFNTALNAGLLNPMSPPLPDRTRSSPTLLDMMAGEPDFHPASAEAPDVDARISTPPAPVPDRQAMLQERVEELGVGSLFNDGKTSDVKLGLVSKDGLSVTLSLHRHLLQAHSRFFRTKLGHRKQRDVEEEESASVPTQIVEISDCEDIDGYTMTLYLMYCKDIRRRLTKEDVPKVLAVLKVKLPILHFLCSKLSCSKFDNNEVTPHFLAPILILKVIVIIWSYFTCSCSNFFDMMR